MSHKFTIYFKNLYKLISGKSSGDQVEVRDFELTNRLSDVLRLKTNEYFVLFDEGQSVEFIFLKKDKNKLNLKISLIVNNKKLKPEIILCLGLLKKKYFEDVVYLAAAMAADKIRPLLTTQVNKNWIDQKVVNRLQKILISACEQSKNFTLPRLLEPIKLKTFIEEEQFDNSKKVCFHIDGKPLFDLLLNLNQTKYDKIYLFFGPEGDFSKEELNLLKKNNVEIYRLTPTVLRSVEAVAVGLGSVRSV